MGAAILAAKHDRLMRMWRFCATATQGLTLAATRRPRKSVIVSRSPCVSQVPMATNGGAHKFNKNENNWLHEHFEPQQVDVVVSSI